MVGSRIRRKRLAAGLSLQEFSDRLKTVGTTLTRAALSNYETGKTAPSAKVLWAIAKVLEESLDYFMTEKEVTLTLHGYRK
ncbi:MAG TPA: helix-turn-helix transcriptional regulator, partial [Spirochaetia bacterium]|nr:helix-turn-helix transcriptional regulator [Spirochaetia bacterium]